MYVLATKVIPLGATVSARDAFMEAWDERVGMVDRVEGSWSECFDALWCESALEQPNMVQVVLELSVVLVMGGAGDKSSMTVLDLEWNSQ
ncbi:hypothetical protein V6N12_029020 [Hibiscus sabdariffa]|uniref:Uncharacterized protein n=1 Tax=Hibiscus sabdariffa TaxID=183260 RepID=A0ABR2F7I6_9ROSI